MQKPDVNILNTDRIGWLMVKLTLPVFLGMFVQTLYNVISTIFVGQFVGPLGIAGLSIVFPLQMLTFGFGMMVGVGGLSLISRLLGAGDDAGAEKALGNGFTLGIAVGGLLMVVILPFLDFWLRLIGASDAVLPYARDYLVFVIGGSPFAIFSFALLSFARAEGNARVGMTAMILGAGSSIALSAVFIVWLDMGVTGAGLALIIAQFFSTLYLLGYYLTGRSYLKIRPANFYPDFKVLKSILAIGTAAFLQTVAGSLSAMILIKMVIQYGGDYALSAFGIVQRVMMFANLPAIVIGQGVQPILGFNYGARRFGLVIKAIKIAAVTSTSLSTLAFFVLYFSPEPLIRIFSNDPELIAQGAYAARLIFLAMPLMGAVMLGTQMFQAIGKAVQSFIAAVVRPIVFLIPLLIVFAGFWQLDGVYLSVPGSDLLTFLLILALMLPVLKKFRKYEQHERLSRIKQVAAPSLQGVPEGSHVIE